MKYKNLDVYWDGLTGSVLLLGEEIDALDFLKEFNSGKFDPSCCPAFSEEEALEIYEEEGVDGLIGLYELCDNIFFFTNGEEIIFDFDKMRFSGIEPFDRDEFLKNFVVECDNEDSLHLYANSENKDDFVYLIVDIENEFGVKKQVDLDTVEFRELSKAKSKNSRTKFMIGLVKATDTLIQLESKKFFDLIEGTNRLFDFISEFYTAILDYDSLIVKDENYDKIIKAIEALIKLK